MSPRLFFPPHSCPCGRLRTGGMLIERPMGEMRPLLIGYINADGDCFWLQAEGVWRHEFTPRAAA